MTTAVPAMRPAAPECQRRRPPWPSPFLTGALRALALGLVMLGGVAAAPRALAEPPIVIAAVSTQASPHQPDGADVGTGVAAALARRHLADGLLGRPVRLLQRHDDCSADSAMAVARDLAALPAGQRPLAVIGHVCAGAAIAAAPIYASAGILFITPGARHPRLTEARAQPPLVFRLAGREDRLPNDVADLIQRRFAGQRVAILNDRSAQARALADAVVQALAAYGIKPVLHEAYAPDERTYAGLVERLAISGAQVAFMPAQPLELGDIAARMRARALETTVIAGDIVAVPDVEAVARRLGPQLVLMLPWMERSPHPAGARPGTMPKADGIAPSAHWLRSHAAAEVVVHAITRTGTLLVADIARALETQVAATRAGPIRFDTRGDAVVTSFQPYQWHAGTWRPLPP